MRVIVTGGAGFLGSRLARALLDKGTLTDGHGQEQPITELVLIDVTEPAAAQNARDEAHRRHRGFRAPEVSDRRPNRRHLPPRRHRQRHGRGGFRSGHARSMSTPPGRCSSCAALPAIGRASCSRARSRCSAATCQACSTYDRAQSADVVRHREGDRRIPDRGLHPQGLHRGRSLRLPTITVRPGRPNAAASSFASGIIREPLNGEDAICPVGPDTRIWVASPRTAIAGLLKANELASDALGNRRWVNVPGISVTAAEMVASLERVAGPDVAKRIRWEPDARIERMVRGWPPAIDNARAVSLGFPVDDSFDAIVRRYLQEDMGVTVETRRA